MPESTPPTDLDAIRALAQRLLIDPEDATPSDAQKLSRIAVDFVALTKKYAALETRYAELSQTSELRRTHAILQKDYVELAESKSQTIQRCNELLEENRRLNRVTFDVTKAHKLADEIHTLANEVRTHLKDEDPK